MNKAKAQDTQQLVDDLTRGDSSAAERLIPIVYDELRALAAACMRSERVGHTLQPTALVNEALMRLLGSNVQINNKTQLLALAARTIRRVLVDHARARKAGKRGGGWQRVTLSDQVVHGSQSEVDVLALDEAMRQLAEQHERSAQVAEMRFFGGMTIEQVAEVLGYSTKTINEDWLFARACLSQALSDE